MTTTLENLVVGLLLWGCVAAAGCSGSERGPRHRQPWLGQQRALVLLLAWEDAPATLSRDQVEEAFFGSERSLATWFDEASGGRFGLSGDVVDWRTASARWVDQPPKEPKRAVLLARSLFADVLDVGAYDSQGNGRIDHLFVVHSGRLPKDRIGPRALFSPGRADRSMVLQSQGTGSVGERVPLGFYLHEAGHRLHRLKDRYGDHRHGNYGIGTWGLMGLGQWGSHAQVPRGELYRFPTHPRARAKVVLGWARERVVSEDTRDLLLEPVEGTGQVVRVVGREGHDLYLEVRSPVGFHRDLPGHGLLVWREPRDIKGTAVLIQADGRDDLARGTDLGRRPVPPLDENFGDASDPFPGSSGVTEVVEPVTGIRISNVRQEGRSVRFDVDVPPISGGVSPVE